ncbi:hypothetical protein NMY22_g16693 [Coprinellus aureogranulatus]|nr:hypothetical protein NMY22_g16693 [Coprinellus aureogranulatus]
MGPGMIVEDQGAAQGIDGGPIGKRELPNALDACVPVALNDVELCSSLPPYTPLDPLHTLTDHHDSQGSSGSTGSLSLVPMTGPFLRDEQRFITFPSQDAIPSSLDINLHRGQCRIYE